MTDEDIRLECLKLATSRAATPDDIVHLAAEFWRFALDGVVPEDADTSTNTITIAGREQVKRTVSAIAGRPASG